MFFDLCLYISLTIFILGVLFQVSRWFGRGLTAQDRSTSIGARVSGVLRSVGGAIFGVNLLVLIKTFVLDVLLLRRSFRQDLYRWVMHMLIFWGFILLLLMHAFESQISEPLLPDYMSTLNPYLFLRDLFGVMVIAGIVMAIYRRFKMPRPRVVTGSMDVVTIVIVTIVIVSGIFLKGSKIASQSEFMRMVDDYSHITYYGYDQELKALESYWVENFGLISPDREGPFPEDKLARGKESHELYCAHCHSQSQWAALSYGSSKLTYPVTTVSDGGALVAFFWYLHILAIFAGLAWVPFGKMFHALTSPLSLFASSVDQKRSNPGASAVRRVMELDACTRCGACSERCSVGVSVESLGNNYILPSEKLKALREVAAGNGLSREKRRELLEGLVVCTTCNRCTEVCPVGINLQDIWTSVRADQARGDLVEPYMLSQLSLDSILRSGGTEAGEVFRPWLVAKEYADRRFQDSAPGDVLTAGRGKWEDELIQSIESTFSYCYKCKTCTLVCPVPEYLDNPSRELGLYPHQIIHATALGLNDLVASSRMLWSCLGCYKCQEECPMGVRVADVLYAHKQAALKSLKAGEKE